MSSEPYIQDYSSNSLPSSRDSYRSQMNPSDEAIFTGELDDYNSMLKILEGLPRDDFASIVFSESGIRFVTFGHKSNQVSAFFASSTFRSFRFNYETQVVFEFQLKDFLESFNMLRSDHLVDGEKGLREEKPTTNELSITTLKIQYRSTNGPLRLQLEDKNKLNQFIQILGCHSAHGFAPLEFPQEAARAVIGLNSSKFYDYISGLDLVGSDFVELTLENGEIPIKLVTKSAVSGEVELEIKEDCQTSNIIREPISVTQNCTFSFSFRTQYLKPALEALKKAKYTQMTCGSNGLLCIEHFHDEQIKDEFRRQLANSEFVDSDQEQRKRSSVEYFIQSEAKPVDDF